LNPYQNTLNDDYAGKELEQILTVYPRDELFQIEQDELLKVAKSILYIQERRRIELFLREDVYGQFVTCLAFFPRDIYNTELRLKVEQVLVDRLGAEDVEFVTHFSESVLARVQFTIRVPQVENRQLPTAEIREKVIELAQSWRDGLSEALSEAWGEEQGNDCQGRANDPARRFKHQKNQGQKACTSQCDVFSAHEGVPRHLKVYSMILSTD